MSNHSDPARSFLLCVRDDIDAEPIPPTLDLATLQAAAEATLTAAVARDISQLASTL